ncbi:MAG: adenylate/guanylate cyclase domain-containing protein [Alphaproteobacteria bacterium]|nr:adenylate/guanylate cyclase domain-containing protein [Alphaproteobacteria bacterium]
MAPRRPPDPGAVLDWMRREGRRYTRMRDFGDALCERVTAAGIPIARACFAVTTLRPRVAGAAYIWRRDDGTQRTTATRRDLLRPDIRNNPVAMVMHDRRALRCRLDAPGATHDFAVLDDFRAEGMTDYIALPVVSSDDTCNALSLATDHPEGFSDADITALGEIAEMLGAIVELQASRRVSRQLMEAYVGRRTGARLLAGQIARGSYETIDAVIWHADLRGFTALTDTLPRGDIIELLNDWFDAVGGALAAEGGEILKFVGYGVLAIFEATGTANVADRCAAALRAASDVVSRVTACNAERAARGRVPIVFGIVVDIGEVAYGNIGTVDRLDFTVTGPAVNQAARLQGLAVELGRTIVASAAFAAAVPDTLSPLGTFALRGISDMQRAYAPGRDMRSSWSHAICMIGCAP